MAFKIITKVHLKTKGKTKMTKEKPALETALEQPQKTRLEQLKENILQLSKDEKATEENLQSATILLLQQKDFEEYQNGIKNKNYFLSNFMKKEFIIRSAEKGCKKATFKINVQAAKALVGLGFMVEDNTVNFTLRPLDRKTYLVSCLVKSENMNNAQICFYNAEYNLNIPMNEQKEVIPEDEQYEDDVFAKYTKQNILKLIN